MVAIWHVPDKRSVGLPVIRSRKVFRKAARVLAPVSHALAWSVKRVLVFGAVVALVGVGVAIALDTFGTWFAESLVQGVSHPSFGSTIRHGISIILHALYS